MKRFLGCCLVGLSAVSAWGAGAPLILDWGVVDTSSAEQQRQSQAIRTSARAPTVQTLSAGGTAPWLVQCNGVIREEWKTALAATGVKLKGYIPENAYLIEATPKQIAAIGARADVAYVGEFRPEYKRAEKVRAKLARVAAKAEADVASAYRVLLMSGDDLAAVAQKIAALTGAEPAVAVGEQIRTELTAAQIVEISGWGEVQWIEPYSRPRLWNDVAARTNMMNVSNCWSVLGLTGAGQTIAVCDTGLDSGNTGTLHRDFTNRVTGFGWTNGVYSAGYSWADYDEHGTHVSGSVLGNGTMSTGLYKGVAYEANLIFQGAQADLSGIPAELGTLFRQAFTNGARIHSDSWGYDDHGYYNTDSRALDQYVWSNKTFLVLVAAGNSGTDSNTTDGVIDPMSVASPATAKNCLTVGASENYRTTGGYSTTTWGSAWPDDYPTTPISADYISRPMSNNVQGLAAFSSRGPCNDGRIKPDIVAPGTDIISTRTRKVAATGWGTVSGNTNYIYMGGTSMATPLTAGAAGLARQWVTTTGGITNPSAALLKALLINGARNMAPGQYLSGSKQEIATARPDKSQGWGHVDLYNTLQPASNQFLNLVDTNSLSTGQTNTFTLTVSATSTNKFILTMAYADYWGTAGSGKILVNDLDLTVRKPGGTTLYANSRTNLDATNNVEMIEFAADESGTYTVKVVGRSVGSGGTQAYALVIRGPEADETPAAPVFGANPGPASTTTGVAVAFAVTTTAGYPTPVLALQSTTASTGYTFAAGTGQLTYTPPVADVGTRTFTFTATNASGAATQTVSVVVYEAPPAAPASIWASATNGTDFTAAWSAVSGATGYRLDVASNSFAGGGGATELLISEYIEADSGSEKYIEIFNGTGSAVSLTNYNLLMFVNGATSPTTIALTGTLANNDVFVVANSSATNSAAIDMSSGSLTFNGDDAIALSNKITGAYVDIIGVIGTDPGTEWGTDPTSTANSTLVRKSSITAGDTNGTDAFDPAAEWDGYAGINVEDDLGAHTFAGGGSAGYVAGYSNQTVAGTSQSVTGLTSGATYYFRARAVNGGGTSSNSPTASVTTTVSAAAPTFGANPGPVSTTAGVAVAFTVSATGTPAPTLALKSTTASTGYVFAAGTGQLTYTPPQADGGTTKTFTVTASNSAGVATQTVNVLVMAGTAPSFTGGAGPYSTTTGVALAFTVSASGTPAATLALAGTTASTNYSFNPGTGQLSYTPVSADIGTRTFTFTASNIAGVVTQTTSVGVSDVPATAPQFGANPGPVGATTGVAMAFTVTTTNGYPAPTLALQSTTASTGYTFTPGTGVLTYTPPEADAGSRTFTFTASNSAGVASQVVSVAVTAGIPGAPASIWASATNSTGFTAAWSSVPNATDYRLDVGTNATFSGGGGSGPGTNCYHNGTLGAGTGGTWTETGLTQGSGYLISLTGDVLITPAMDFTVSTSETLSFNARTYGGANSNNNTITVSISTNNGGGWATLGTRTPLSTTLTAMSPFDLSSYNHIQVMVKFENLGATASIGAGIDEVLVTNLTGGSSAAYVAGYSNRTVAGTSQSVTGLAANATYYFRARAVNASGTGTYSSVANATTASNAPAGTPPVMNAVASQAALTGRDVARTATATPTDGDPILSYGCTSAVDNATWDFDTGSGDFLFAPTAAQIGANVFAFTAIDKDGTSAPATMTVTVSAASAPTMNGFSNRVTFAGATLEATATATEPDGDAVTFACTSTVDGAVWAVDTNGYFLFEPTAAQIGTNFFSFTAADRDGTSAPAVLSVRVYSAEATNDFTQWVEDEGENPASSNFFENADFDGDGRTTWEEYVADTDPAASNSVLALAGSYFIASQVGDTTGQIRFTFPASTSRFYQLEYCTGLTNHAVGTTNLGWGVPGMVVTSSAPATWYGVIRVFLQEP